ncbi:MAG: sigma-70 family RNA polymerase sigma factor [Bacteroidetes bacterium]|nr:sigma-70 family RNA polymerase sigma factor [Bacteroidota bacterium]
MVEKGQWTDDQLVAAIRAGGRQRNDAWQYIYKAWRAFYLKPVFSLGGREEQVDEVFSYVVLAVERQVCKPDFALHSASLRTYFIESLTRKWAEAQKISAGRQKRTVEFDPESRPAWEGLQPGVEEDYIRQERAEMVNRGLEQLGERCKTLLTLYGKGFKMEEIAGEMGYGNVQTAKNQVAICRDRLRDFLREKI